MTKRLDRGQLISRRIEALLFMSKKYAQAGRLYAHAREAGSRGDLKAAHQFDVCAESCVRVADKSRVECAQIEDEIRAVFVRRVWA